MYVRMYVLTVNVRINTYVPTYVHMYKPTVQNVHLIQWNLSITKLCNKDTNEVRIVVYKLSPEWRTPL